MNRRIPAPDVRKKARRTLTALAVLFSTLGVVALWVWLGQGERRALRRLPAAERGALYERTLDNLTTVCADSAAGGLSDFCREQAEFILQFPECDEACQTLARRYLPRATR